MVVAFLILALLIALGAVIFALQNADPILVAFFSFSFEGSLALVLLVTFAVGFVAGVLVVLPYLIKRRLIIHRLKKELSQEETLDDDDTHDEDELLSNGVKGGM